MFWVSKSSFCSLLAIGHRQGDEQCFLPVRSDRSEGLVKVIGMCQKVEKVGSFTFYNEIDASGGSVEKMSKEFLNLF